MAWTFLCQRHLAAFLRSSAIKHTTFSRLTLPQPSSTNYVSNGIKNIALSRSLSNHCNSSSSIYFLRSGRFKSPVLTIVRTISRGRVRFSNGRNSSHLQDSNRTTLIYVVAIFIFMIGGAYAGVPLYKVFCQATGLGGQAVRGHDTSQVETMKAVDRPIRVIFNADVASSMRWNFRPQQTEVTVRPGETALAFYTAKNPTDKPIIGISTYNVLPYDAGQYFNKIQCFCFEEQRLNPKEEVDMPVFFYIDPEFAEDPKLETVNNITLSYTFFEARDGLTLPLPGYPQPHDPPQPQQ